MGALSSALGCVWHAIGGTLWPQLTPAPAAAVRASERAPSFCMTCQTKTALPLAVSHRRFAAAITARPRSEQGARPRSPFARRQGCRDMSGAVAGPRPEWRLSSPLRWAFCARQRSRQSLVRPGGLLATPSASALPAKIQLTCPSLSRRAGARQQPPSWLCCPTKATGQQQRTRSQAQRPP